MEAFLGVDIGINGAISLVNHKNFLLLCEPIPTTEHLINDKIRRQYNIQEINSLIKGWANEYQIIRAGIERLRPIPNQASQVAFSLGGGSMMFKTLFTVYGIPYIEFEPRMWQKEIFKRAGVQYTSDTTKIASITASKNLFPGANFKRTEKCKVDSSDLTDSACIALYTKLTN